MEPSQRAHELPCLVLPICNTCSLITLCHMQPRHPALSVMHLLCCAFCSAQHFEQCMLLNGLHCCHCRCYIFAILGNCPKHDSILGKYNTFICVSLHLYCACHQYRGFFKAKHYLTVDHNLDDFKRRLLVVVYLLGSTSKYQVGV